MYDPAQHLAARLATLQEEHDNPAAALVAYEKEVDLALGLATEGPNGELVESVGWNGMPKLAEGDHVIKADAIGIGALAESLGLKELFNPAGNTGVSLTEASVGVGIDPTNFVNISAWNTTVSKMIRARILEKYDNPSYIGLSMVQVINTDQNGEKMIGLGGLHKDFGAAVRKPNTPHARATFGERYLETPETQEYALAIDITKEAVFFDRTGDVMRQADAVGDALAYQQDLAIGREILGLTTSYKYKGTTYSTYLTSGAWVNDHANQLVDETQLDTASQLFVGMKDPETQRHIRVPKSEWCLLHSEERTRKWDRVFNATEVRETNSTVQTLAPRDGRANPRREMSPEWTTLLADEGGITEAQAREWWIIGSTKKAFAWIQNWGLQVQSTTPGQYEMVDRGIARSVFANHRGVAATLEPRYVVRNKHTGG